MRCATHLTNNVDREMLLFPCLKSWAWVTRLTDFSYRPAITRSPHAIADQQFRRLALNA